MSIPLNDKEQADKMNDFLASRARKLYSTSPRLGSDIVKIVLTQ